MTYKEALEKIAAVNAMDYEYQAWAREALAQKEQPYAHEAAMYSNDRMTVDPQTGNVSIGTIKQEPVTESHKSVSVSAQHVSTKCVGQPLGVEPVALETVYETIIHWDKGGGKRSRRELARRIVALYTTPQPVTESHKRKPLWIDPNDKTQEKFLPNIGEPVMFCCRGETYIGIHTGGGFKDAFNSEGYFNTWSCKWMPIQFIEAAHGIKEKNT